MQRRNFIKLLGVLPVLSIADITKLTTKSQPCPVSTRSSTVTYINTTGNEVWANFNGTTNAVLGHNCTVTKHTTGIYHVAFIIPKG